MKWMYSALICALIIFGTACSSKSQKAQETEPAPPPTVETQRNSPRAPGERGTRGAEQRQAMMEQLALSEEQTVKFNEIEDGFRKKMQDMRSQSQGGFSEEMRANMMKLREERDADMKEILTEEQYAKYKEINAQRGPRRGGPGGGRQ